MGKAPREVVAEIDALNAEGQGIAHLGEKELLVRNALPGESVLTRVLKRRRGRLFGDGVEVVEQTANADRVAPACPYFPRCGGCSMHHLEHGAQLDHKQQLLADQLEALGVEVQTWAAPVGVTRLGYRRKARLGVRQVGEDVLVGFRESFSNRVARMDACAVLSPQASALLAPLRQVLRQLSVAAQVPQIELAQGDGQPVVMLRHLAPLDADDVERLRRFAARHAVGVLLQSGGYDTLQTLDGKAPDNLSYALPEYGLLMRFAPAQFTQVNQAMNEALIGTVVASLGGYGGRAMRGRRIADLFCGIGNITLPLARAGASVAGVELASEAIDMARENAKLNGLDTRTSFAVADLYADGCAIPEDVDTLVLDPPRSGAGPNLGEWLKTFTGRDVVYVSCNPATFASDAVVLKEAGFVLSRVGIYDMFPHTAHVETVGLFVRRQ